MSEDRQESSKGPFIPPEIRPLMESDPERYPPLEPGTSKEEIQRRARAIIEETQRVPPELDDGRPLPEMWKMIISRSPEVQWTVLDGEAVLLNLENGVYYTLNRVGTKIWEHFTGDQPLEGVLSAICEGFDVTEDMARDDLTALVARLRQEGLIAERS